MINTQSPNDEEQTLRNFLLPGAQPHHMFTAKAVGRLLKRHLDEPVMSGERTLVLRRKQDAHAKMFSYLCRAVPTRRAAGIAPPI